MMLILMASFVCMYIWSSESEVKRQKTERERAIQSEAKGVYESNISCTPFEIHSNRYEIRLILCL